ncbi:helix-turn-helix domain-containing protein [Ochrobactrum sp. S1502_03]|uniref:helix-turn-helix domain-containing protein n=1 Tax=Ochrobactrum sp. S1502_03 TaxID=3108451 RepID=UPI0037C5C613
MQENTNRPKLLVQQEVAELLGCSCSTVQRLRLTGRLEYMPGRPILITEKAVQDYLAQKQADKEQLEKLRKRELSPRGWALMAAFRQNRRRTPKC